MSREKRSWRSPFRGFAQVIPRETSKIQPESLHIPEFESHEIFDHLARSESLQSSTQESSFYHDDSIHASSWSAQTSCTSPSSQAFVCPGLDLEDRLDFAYRYIRNMPPSPISPCTSRLTGDHLTYRKQLGVPQHSVVNLPTLNMPSLPNPHATHERSRSQPFPSSFPSESRLASWTLENSPSTPQFRHGAQAKAYVHSSNYHRHSSLAKSSSSLQIDTNIYPYIHSTTSPVHSSKTSPISDQIMGTKNIQTTPMIVPPVLPSPIHRDSTGIRAPLLPRQEDSPISSPQKKRSKLIKRRPADTISPHLSYRIALEEACTSVSSIHESNDISNQSFVPLVSPPSPLHLDIPTHQPCHDRGANFVASPKQISHHRSISVSLSTTHKISASTEALASLAWIGTPPMSTSVSTSCVPLYHTKPNAVPGDEEINMSLAVDESLPDEVVIERLETIRKESTRKDKHIPSHILAYISPSSMGGFNYPEFRLGDSFANNTSSSCQSGYHEPVQQPLPASVILDDAEWDYDDATVWRTARRALLCIREIVRTERKYQDALKALLTEQTANPPPPLMLSYLPDLVRASETLLKGFIDDPSAWGVSTAFMACEDDIETAMVSWCTVAGNFFTDNPSNEVESASVGGKWRRRKTLLLSATSHPLTPVAGKSNANSIPAPLPPLLAVMDEAGSRIRDRQRTDEQYWKVSDDSSVNSYEEQSYPSKDDHADGSKGKPPTRMQSVRDLAIQPTQRVMRYVLLYRDLLECTPHTSPSRPLVERALEAATHIASKCNCAQGNTAFLRR